MRSVLSFVLAAVTVTSLFASSPVEAQVNSRHDYQFPYHDPYFATLTVRLLKPKSVLPTPVLIEALPGRNNVALLEGRGTLALSLFAQRGPAPLIYLVPGVGGSTTDGSVLWLAESLFSRGFSVLVAPSPLNWQFVLSQSTTAIPGYSPEDAKDLQRVFLKGREKAERQYGLKVTRTAVMGYSLGGLNSAFLMKMEREQAVLGIERAVMINPPLHLPAAISTLDQLNDVGNKWTPKERSELWGYVLNAGSAALSRDILNPFYFLGLDRVLRLSTDQSKYLIGSSFRSILADSLFTSQQVNDIGVFRAKATRGSRSLRQAEAAAMPFARYMEQVAFPYWAARIGKKSTLQEFVADADLFAMKDMIISDPAFRLLHNQDDFLTRPEHLLAIAEPMGERAILYPFGGHVGNLWKQMNLDDIFSMVKDLL